MVLGVIFVGRRSMFLDETVSYTIATLGWHGFWHIVATREGNMVLYVLLLKGWLGVGDSDTVIRLLSVAAFVASVAAIHGATRRLAGERAAAVAGLLLAVDPFAIHYAQTARGYELAVLLVTWSTLLFIRALERQTWTAWLGYAVIAAAGVYAHFFALLVPAAHAVSLLCVPPNRLRWRKLVGAGVAVLVLLIPFFYLLSHNSSSGIDWSAGNPIGRVFVKLHAHPPLAALFLIVCAAVVVTLILTVRRWRGRAFRSEATWRWALPICWLVVPPAIVVIVAVVIRPLFVPYYFIVCLPGGLALLALIIDRVPVSPVVAAVAGVALLGSVLGDVDWYHGAASEDWRGTTRYVLTADRSGDGVLFVAPYVRIPFSAYLRREPAALRRRAPVPVYPAAPFSVNETRFDYYVTMGEAPIARRATRFSQIWLVASHVDIEGTIDPRYLAAEQALGRDGFTPRMTRVFNGVTVTRYDARSTG